MYELLRPRRGCAVYEIIKWASVVFNGSISIHAAINQNDGPQVEMEEISSLIYVFIRVNPNQYNSTPSQF